MTIVIIKPSQNGTRWVSFGPGSFLSYKFLALESFFMHSSQRVVRILSSLDKAPCYIGKKNNIIYRYIKYHIKAILNEQWTTNIKIP